jgi:putative glycosyltransferase (TIGR04348 family)
MPSKPTVCIVCPATQRAHDGLAVTAERWRQWLEPVADVAVATEWSGASDEALIALHASGSADSVARFAHAHPQRPLAVVLTGSDVARDIDADPGAAAALSHASHLVVRQARALSRLGEPQQARARVIEPSAPRRVMRNKARTRFDVAYAAPLCAEADPLTLLNAVCALPPDSPVRLLHMGTAYDESLASAARHVQSHGKQYQWLGEPLPHDTRRWIARARTVVHCDAVDGAALAVVDAVRSHVPVLATRIPVHQGLLGSDYEGLFNVGDSRALAALLLRVSTDEPFLRMLARRCEAQAPRFTPELESAAVRNLLADMLVAREAPAPRLRARALVDQA